MSAVVKAVKKLGIKARVEEFAARVQVITKTRIEAEEAAQALIKMNYRDVMVTPLRSENTVAVEALVPLDDERAKRSVWYA